MYGGSYEEIGNIKQFFTVIYYRRIRLSRYGVVPGLIAEIFDNELKSKKTHLLSVG